MLLPCLTAWMFMQGNSERAKARRAREREERLQREAEEALLLAQYLRRKTMERELAEEREAKRLRDYLKSRKV